MYSTPPTQDTPTRKENLPAYIYGDAPLAHIPDEKIKKVADAFHAFKDAERFTKIVSVDEAVKNDYNLSPSRYVETGTGEEYKDIPTLLTELGRLEEESRRIDQKLGEVFQKLGLKPN